MSERAFEEDFDQELDLELEFATLEESTDLTPIEETTDEIVAQAEQFLGRKSRRTHRKTRRKTNRHQRRGLKRLRREVRRKARRLRRAGKDADAEKLEGEFKERRKQLEREHDREDAKASAPLQFLLELSERQDAQTVIRRLDANGTFSNLLKLIGYDNLWKDPRSIQILPPDRKSVV